MIPSPASTRGGHIGGEDNTAHKPIEKQTIDKDNEHGNGRRHHGSDKIDDEHNTRLLLFVAIIIVIAFHSSAYCHPVTTVLDAR